jgi:hypothetical protein
LGNSRRIHAPAQRGHADRRGRRAAEENEEPALARDHGERREAPARLRARRASHRGGMVRGHQVPDRGGAEVRRQAPGVHPALRRARALDAGGRAQSQDRARRHRGDRARAVLRARREGIRLRRRPARGRHDERRGRLGERPGPVGGRQAHPRGRARHLAGEGRRHLRSADRGRVRAARPRQGERQGRIRLRQLQAEVLQHPGGRAGGRARARDRQPPHAAGAHACHRLGPRLPAGHHARLRGRRPVPRRRRGIRGQELARRQVQPAGAAAATRSISKACNASVWFSFLRALSHRCERTLAETCRLG